MKKIVYKRQPETLNKDLELIVSIYENANNRPLTDSEVLEKLKPGSTKIHLMRAKINKMINMYIIIECGEVKGNEGKNIRLTKLRHFEQQQTLI